VWELALELVRVRIAQRNDLIEPVLPRRDGRPEKSLHHVITMHHSLQHYRVGFVI
jgi:hypothetical protein